MPRALIVYFSQGGTTARVARRIAAGLEESGHEVHLHNLSREAARLSETPNAREYDLLGVGSPTHYYRLPPPVADFLAGPACSADRIPTFGFLLYGTYSGWAGRALVRALGGEEESTLGFFSCRGADRYVGYLRKGHLFSPGHPTARELAAAETFGRAVGRGASAPAGTQIVEEQLGWVYRLERHLTAPWLSRHVYSRLLRVNADRCTSCGACVRRCPTGNVTISPSGTPTWGRDCLFCLYCQLVCTEEAISSPVTWPPFDVLLSHNVRHAAADPDLDHVRVVHTSGRTHLL